jgi:Fe2+ transport system protein FeoA
MSKLQQLKKGERKTIDRFLDDALAVKLMGMGVLPGSTIEVVRRSFLGHTMYVKVDHLQLAIRKNEAACIVVK